MKKAVILINAYANGASELYQSERLKTELSALGVSTGIVRNFLTAGVAAGEAVRMLDADFCVYLDKDKYAGELLERAGMRLLNRPRAVAACDDKMATLIALAGNGIPVPDTYAAPLCYTLGAKVPKSYLREIGQKLGFPLVVKTCYGSLGKGVFKADDWSELYKIAQELRGMPHLFQKFVASSAGRDVRVLVIGGKYFSAMLRTSACDFRSNLELGGHGEPFEPDGRTRSLCEKVASLLELDYCGIDLLFSDEGFTVCEVNSNAFFGGMERVTGKNVAKAYAEYILRIFLLFLRASR
ncbi:MAG: RimK family alpha-L-glutamate ligase [Clostridia bacterium]|nr:RimK family alpha-L-glutamate ligase [Clostridia bacterium]